MPSPTEAYKAFKMNGSGCIFEHYGRIPENIYATQTFTSPIEEAVYNNDAAALRQLCQDGERVSCRLSVGQMSCIEYAAMMGYTDILEVFIENSPNANILKQYFALNDVVDRAYLISSNKTLFFDQEGLAEANRYEAALYTAVVYNKPQCVALLARYLGPRDPPRHNFYTNDNTQETFNALQLAKFKGHTECFEILSSNQEVANRVQQIQAC